MKKKIKLLLALVMSLTMVFGMSTTAFADAIRLEFTVNKDLFVPGKVWNDFAGGMLYLDYSGVDEGLSAFYMVDLTTGSQADIIIEKGHEYVYKIDLVLTAGIEAPDNLEECFSCNLGFSSMNSSVVDLPEYGSRVVINLTTNVISLKDPSNYLNHQTPSSCDHDFVWQTITAPTATTYGTEGYVCSKCGATKDVRVKSPLDDWVRMQINKAKPGDVLTIDFGPWNSYPLWMMQMIADKPTVTYVFKYTYQGNKYEVTIKPGDRFALDCDWYGPLKMPTLFDTVITKW